MEHPLGMVSTASGGLVVLLSAQPGNICSIELGFIMDVR